MHISPGLQGPAAIFRSSVFVYMQTCKYELTCLFPVGRQRIMSVRAEGNRNSLWSVTKCQCSRAWHCAALAFRLWGFALVVQPRPPRWHIRVHRFSGGLVVSPFGIVRRTDGRSISGQLPACNEPKIVCDCVSFTF